MKNRALIFSSLIAIILSFNSYAFDVSGQVAVANIKSGNTQILETEGLHIEESEDSNLYNKDKNDTIRTGWTYDENGDLYFSYADGVLLRDRFNDELCYFDADGKWVPSGKLKITQEMCCNFESGSTLQFKTLNDSIDFINYYLLNYRLEDITSGFSLPRYPDGSCTLTLNNDRKYDREGLKQSIINAVGELEGNTVEEKVYDACTKLQTFLVYDLNYQKADMEKALADRRGVCWHSAKLAQALLEEEGITVEILMVKTTQTNEEHVILRYLNEEGKWLYFDTTWIKSDVRFTNLSYSSVVQLYKPIKYIKYR